MARTASTKTEQKNTAKTASTKKTTTKSTTAKAAAKKATPKSSTKTATKATTKTSAKSSAKPKTTKGGTTASAKKHPSKTAAKKPAANKGATSASAASKKTATKKTSTAKSSTTKVTKASSAAKASDKKAAPAKKTTASSAKTTRAKASSSAKDGAKAAKKTSPRNSQGNAKATGTKAKNSGKSTTKAAKKETKAIKATTAKAQAIVKSEDKPKVQVTDADRQAASARQNARRDKEGKATKKPAKITPNDRQPAAKGQTKEEQAKKKFAFNTARVGWFDQYMKGNMPSVYQMHISPNRDVLLTTDEQIRLAEFIQAGIAAKLLSNQISQELGEIPVHLQKTIVNDQEQMVEMLAKAGYPTSKFKRSRKERRKLERLVQQAEDARNLFAEKNLGLVTMIAGRRKKMSNTAAGVDQDDLIAEGMNGLMIAIDHYNPATGFKFSTPAAWWIEQPIRNYLDSKTKTIHMPTHMNNIYKSIYYAERALRDIYPDDSMITTERIAEYCQSKGRDITVEKIKEAMELRVETVSYDAPMSDGDPNNKSMIELVASDDNISEEVVGEIGERDNINRMLALIDDDKKREVLRDWYSSQDMHDLVILSNVARKHCITKERVRALKADAERELFAKISKIADERGVTIAEAVTVEADRAGDSTASYGI